MAVAKRPGREKWLEDLEGKARENRTKEGPKTGVRTSGKTNNTPGWPNLHKTGPGTEKHIKRGAKALFSLSLSLSLSPMRWGDLLFTCLDRCALTPQRRIFLLLSK